MMFIQGSSLFGETQKSLACLYFKISGKALKEKSLKDRATR